MGAFALDRQAGTILNDVFFKYPDILLIVDAAGKEEQWPTTAANTFYCSFHTGLAPEPHGNSGHAAGRVLLPG